MSIKNALAIVLILVTSAHVSAQEWRTLPEEIDRFAASFLDDVQLLSIREGVEYCGFIGYNRKDELTTTKPKRGKADGCLPPFFLPWGFDIIASYHTHGSYSPHADTEVPSVRDLESDFDEGIDGYVATPGGRLWVNIRDEGVTVMLCGRDCLTSDPNFLECDALFPAEEYTIPDLLVREARDSGQC